MSFASRGAKFGKIRCPKGHGVCMRQLGMGLRLNRQNNDNNSQYEREKKTNAGKSDAFVPSDPGLPWQLSNEADRQKMQLK